MKYALIGVPDDFEKGQCYDCPLYMDDCCVLHCRYDECSIEIGVPLDKIMAEIEALPKTYPFVNHIDAYVKEDDVKKIFDKYKAEIEPRESEG